MTLHSKRVENSFFKCSGEDDSDYESSSDYSDDCSSSTDSDLIQYSALDKYDELSVIYQTLLQLNAPAEDIQK